MASRFEKMIKAILATGMFAGLSGCIHDQDPLLVYAGKGLKFPVEQIELAFEEKTGIQVDVIYAGSATLLATMQKTEKGDIFIPGSQSYIQKAGDAVTRSASVGYHIPTVGISKAAAAKISSFKDLVQADVRLAVGNPQMSAIGRATNAILSASDIGAGIQDRIVIEASTVNELLELINSGHVDAALIWRDMLKWDEASELTEIPIPQDVNKVAEVQIGLLAHTLSEKNATKFYEFVVTEGQQIFRQHGYAKD